MGGFVYSEEGGVLFVNQYIDSEVSACGLHLLLETDLPYSGKVSITVRGKGRFACRIPVWQTEICCKADGTFLQPKSCDDYLYFEIDGEKKIEIVFGMRPRFVYANDCVRADSGRKAVEYGPFLLCAEEKDNGKSCSMWKFRRSSMLKLNVRNMECLYALLPKGSVQAMHSILMRLPKKKAVLLR